MNASNGTRVDGASRSRWLRVVGLALVVYGAATLLSLIAGIALGALRSWPLAALAVPCGALAITAGVLVRRGALAARPVLVSFAAAVLVLNVSAMAEAGEIDGVALGLATALGAAALFALCHGLARANASAVSAHPGTAETRGATAISTATATATTTTAPPSEGP